ncbi:MAG: SMC family ATPase [Methanoregula sp.]|jgi:exonuclease SbcC|uniref:AAA family ATPase n=1 Tax=Methanoregula sp. TaxID=2052170 RepID=UPI003C1618CB
MIIDRLILKNFKRFRDERIEFADGITGILGNNGTGKSSLVTAIFFALYGVQATGIAPEYIVSASASPKDKCEVRLDFSVGGEKYAVVRTFKKGKTVQHDADFYKDGKLRASGVSQVEAEVRRTLGMGPVDFRNTIYAAQKDLLTLLENTPGKRKEWFLRALGIDYLSVESQKILKERADTAEGDLRLLEGELKGLRERQDPAELARLESETGSLNNEIKALEGLRVSHAAKKAGAEAALRGFAERKIDHARRTEKKHALASEQAGLLRQRDGLVKRLADLSAQEQEYRTLEGQVAGYPAKKQHLESLRVQKTEFDRLNGEQQFLERERADLAARVNRQKEQCARLDKDTEKAASLRAEIRTALRIVGTVPDAGLDTIAAAKIAEVERALGTSSAQQDRLAADRTKLLADRDAIHAAGADGTCPLCRQKLGTHYPAIEQEFETRLAAIQDEAIKVLAAQEKLAQEKAGLDLIAPKLRELRSCADAQKIRETLDKELAELLETLTKKEEAGRNLAGQVAALHFDPAAFAAAEKALAALERMQVRYNELARQLAQAGEIKTHVAGIGERIAQNEAAQKEADALIAAVKFDPSEGTQLDAQLAQVTAALREADTGCARATERYRHAEEKIAEIKKEQEKTAGLEQRIAAATEEIELLKLTRSIIAGYVLYVMQVVRSRIEGEVSRIISEITGGRYEQVLLDEDFNLLVRDVDDDYAIDRFSGGEQDDIAVALRIALSRYLAELHNVQESTLLIFDEIFGSQDDERRNNLLTALRTQESRFPQIILISHIPEMQGEFATTLVVEMGTDLSSRVKVVE